MRQNQHSMELIPKDKGSYLLCFRLASPAAIEVGKLGKHTLLPGQYGYIGSAFGPGGIQARVWHHLLPSLKPHWHLDYVKPHVEWISLGWSVATTRFECHWIQQLIQLEGISIPIPGFGASDCRQGCPAHFFQCQQEPAILFEFLNIRSHFYFMYNKADF